ALFGILFSQLYDTYTTIKTLGRMSGRTNDVFNSPVCSWTNFMAESNVICSIKATGFIPFSMRSGHVSGVCLVPIQITTEQSGMRGHPLIIDEYLNGF